MRRCTIGVCLGLFAAVALPRVSADDALYAPTPAEPVQAPLEAVPPLPGPHSNEGVVIGAESSYFMPPVELYRNVRVRDRNRIHPCAVPTVVSVCDPCGSGCLVHVEICVPPCECLDVCQRWQGRKVTYDYGDYQIEITGFHSGQILIDYDS